MFNHLSKLLHLALKLSVWNLLILSLLSSPSPIPWFPSTAPQTSSGPSLLPQASAYNLDAHLFMASVAYEYVIKNEPIALYWSEDILRMYEDEITAQNERNFRFLEATTWADDVRKGQGTW